MPPVDRAALRQAVRARNIERLESVLATVKESGLTAELAIEVTEARRLLEILKRMNTIKTSLQELKQTMVCELVNQTTPHKITVTILKCVMLLLGVPEKELEDWASVQEQIGLTARKHYAFIRRLVRVRSTKVDVSQARRAQWLLSRFTLDVERIKSISEPLVLFYSWLTTVTEEVIGIADARVVEL